MASEIPFINIKSTLTEPVVISTTNFNQMIQATS